MTDSERIAVRQWRELVAAKVAAKRARLLYGWSLEEVVANAFYTVSLAGHDPGDEDRS